MYIGTDWPPATPYDDQIYTIDFINDLNTGEIVSSAVVSFTLDQGADADPSSHVIGSYTITDDTLVGQRIRGLIAGNVYNLSITAVTNLGMQIELNAYLPCQAVF